MIQKLHIGTTLAALFLFFLPWIDIQCSNKSVATQSGVQTIYGGCTTATQEAGMTMDLGSPSRQGKAARQSLDYSVLIGLAMVAVVAAVLSSFVALWSAAVQRRQTVGILCTIALALIGLQMSIGFPAKKSIARSMSSDMESSFGNRRADRIDDAAEKMNAAMMGSFEIRPLPALYLELLMLGLPTLVLANDLIDRVKRQAAGRDA